MAEAASAQTEDARSSEVPRWVCVGDVESFGERTDVRIHGRQVTIVRLPHVVSGEGVTKFAAIDSICYHMGGPLGQQGTMMVSPDGRVCLRCPWHRYVLNLEDGTRVGLPSDAGMRQRTHRVEIRRDDSLTSSNDDRKGGNIRDRDTFSVWVLLDDKPHGSVASDEYAFGPKHELMKSNYCMLPAFDW